MPLPLQRSQVCGQSSDLTRVTSPIGSPSIVTPEARGTVPFTPACRTLDERLRGCHSSISLFPSTALRGLRAKLLLPKTVVVDRVVLVDSQVAPCCSK